MLAVVVMSSNNMREAPGLHALYWFSMTAAMRPILLRGTSRILASAGCHRLTIWFRLDSYRTAAWCGSPWFCSVITRPDVCRRPCVRDARAIFSPGY